MTDIRTSASWQLYKGVALQLALFALFLCASRTPLFNAAYLSGVLQHHLLLALSAFIAASAGALVKSVKDAKRMVYWREISIVTIGAIGAFVASLDATYSLGDLALGEYPMLVFYVLSGLAIMVVFAIVTERSAAKIGAAQAEAAVRSDEEAMIPSWAQFLGLLLVNLIAGIFFWLDAAAVSTPSPWRPLLQDSILANWQSALLYGAALAGHAFLITSIAMKGRVARAREKNPGLPAPHRGWLENWSDILLLPFLLLLLPLLLVWFLWQAIASLFGGGVAFRTGDTSGDRAPSSPLPFRWQRAGIAYVSFVGAAFALIAWGLNLPKLMGPCAFWQSGGCVTVYFATPRIPETNMAIVSASYDGAGFLILPDQPQRFTTKANTDNTNDNAGPLYLGKARVSVPRRKDRTPADASGTNALTERALLKADLREQAEKKAVRVTSISLSTEEGFNKHGFIRSDYYADLASAATKGAGDAKLLLIVHGFDTTFDDSLGFAARYALDLGWQMEVKDQFPFGQPVLFTWPTTMLGEGVARRAGISAALCLPRARTMAALLGCGAKAGIQGGGTASNNYAEAIDRRSDDAAAHLSRYLTRLVTDPALADISELNIMAYSMGNDVLAEALTKIDPDEWRDHNLTIRIASHAADTTHDKFRKALEPLNQHINNVSVYVNDTDTVLAFARLANAAINFDKTVDPGADDWRELVDLSIVDRVGRPESKTFDGPREPFRFAEGFEGDPPARMTVDVSGVKSASAEGLGVRTYAVLGAHAAPQSHPGLLADTACFYNDRRTDERFIIGEQGLYRLRDNADAPSLRPECLPTLKPGFLCEDVESSWNFFANWLRSKEDRAHAKECKANEVRIELLLDRDPIIEPVPALVDIFQVSGPTAAPLSFLCKRDDMVADSPRCSPPPSQPQPEEIPLADYVESFPGLCTPSALIAVGSESGAGDGGNNLAQRRSASLARAVRAKCGDDKIIYQLVLGQVERNEVVEDRNIVLLGINPVDGGDLNSDIIFEELRYWLQESGNDAAPVLLLDFDTQPTWRAEPNDEGHPVDLTPQDRPAAVYYDWEAE